MSAALESIGQTGDGLQQRSDVGTFPGHPSMWFFIIGDLLIFGAYFISYMAYRTQDHALFLHSQQSMNQGVGATNTIILLTSSLFVALGTEAVRDGKNRDSLRLFGLAIAFGALFPVLKFIEWIPKIEAGHTPGENLYFMFYYVMTGLHLFHVLLGLVILGFVIRNIKTASAPDVRFVETGAIYWHMVDLLWLVLFALFYLMR